MMKTDWFKTIPKLTGKVRIQWYTRKEVEEDYIDFGASLQLQEFNKESNKFENIASLYVNNNYENAENWTLFDWLRNVQCNSPIALKFLILVKENYDSIVLAESEKILIEVEEEIRRLQSLKEEAKNLDFEKPSFNFSRYIATRTKGINTGLENNELKLKELKRNSESYKQLKQKSAELKEELEFYNSISC